MADNYHRLPFFISWLIKGLLCEQKAKYLTGDFEEVYNDIYQERGKVNALRWLWGHVLVSLPPILKRIFYWRINMFNNYVKVAFRNIMKYRGFSSINILGLAIGMAVCLLILLFVRNEFSFDRFHQHRDRIYRAEAHFLAPDGSVRGAFCSLGPSWVTHLENEFPEMEHVVRMYGPGNTRISVGTNHFTEERLFFAEEDIFEVFSISMVKGDPKTALKNPGNVVISKTMAIKYFGNQDPMGKQVKVDNRFLLQVTGVMKDFPSNSHIHPDFLASYISLKGLFGQGESDYFHGSRNFGDNVAHTYIRLSIQADPEELSSRFPGFIDKTLGIRTDESGRVVRYSQSAKIFLRKVTDIHLHSHTRNELEPNSDIRYVKLFTLIAIFILVIACINFMNLSTARAAKRAREIGIRKVVGASRKLLSAQFLNESLIMAILAMVLALIICWLLLPSFSAFSGHTLTFNSIVNGPGLLIIFMIILASGLVAGLYPAIFLSAFRPTTILRGELTRGSGGAILRKILVVFQFAISTALIISVGVVFKQMQYLKNADLGFNSEDLILVSANNDIRKNWLEVKNSLLKNPHILSATASKRAPSGRLMDAPGFSVEINGEIIKSNFHMPHNRVEHDFFKTYGMKIVAGRDFSVKFPTDASEAYIINETGARRLGFQDPKEAVGIPITAIGHSRGKIIGVVADFNYESLHNRIVPMITYIKPSQMNTVSVRVAKGNVKETINHLQKVWDRFNPGYSINYSYLDDRLQALYKNESRMMEMFSYFSILAILVACLGLFGLSSFTTEQRTKEIGIRKVLGASVTHIIFLLSRNFTKWVLVANIIACPLAYFAMRTWLGNFAYKISIGWTIFVISAIVTLLISLLTVSYQAVKSALSNPVEALKYE
jgi:putative ABC transport system permease protein